MPIVLGTFTSSSRKLVDLPYYAQSCRDSMKALQLLACHDIIFFVSSTLNFFIILLTWCPQLAYVLAKHINTYIKFLCYALYFQLLINCTSGGVYDCEFMQLIHGL